MSLGRELGSPFLHQETHMKKTTKSAAQKLAQLESKIVAASQMVTVVGGAEGSESAAE